jgi:alginate O-acetyltransferase complex protein AlgJ
VKNRVLFFLLAGFLFLAIIPIVNIVSVPAKDAVNWKSKSFLYNLDFVSKRIALFCYKYGISIEPKQVIIGRDDWLFLGDMYGVTLTTDRRPPIDADFALGQQLGAAATAWDEYLKGKGVKLFRIMIGPNKGTIYPELMPAWARPPSPNATDYFFAGTTGAHYIDLRRSLLAAKASQPAALYYKTDTHWNALGGALAFREFAQQVSKFAPELQWPQPAAYDLIQVNERAGGDLAKFLRLSEFLSDSEPMIALLKPPSPLNKKKVLWVRDSFGVAMAPLMAATFSEVREVYSGLVFRPDGFFEKLVDEWQPDYVFFTLVERDKGELLKFRLSKPFIAEVTAN